MTAYLIQLLIFQALFLGVYELFLKKETFFSLNRIYLLATPFFAAIIPLLEFEILQNVVPMEGIVQLPTLIISENSSSSNLSTALDLTGGLGLFGVIPSAVEGWLLIGYLLGAVVSFALFLRKYVQLQQLKNSGKPEKHGKLTIVRIPNSRIACTFFNTIFLGENLSEAETSQILVHELAHVEQKHSWDLLLFEFLRIVLWFDPFVYRYQSQLSTLHEYIADEAVTKHSEKTTYFQDLLNATFGTRQISFTNQFFKESLIKKRIMMLQKPKSNRNAKLKYLLVLPLIFTMLTYVACSEDKTVNETQEMLPPPPPPPGPPTEAYQDYLEFKKYMKSKDASFDWTFEEYQKFTSIAKEGTVAEGTIQITETEMDDVSQVPFSVVDQVPIFPGCENLADNQAQKECMSKKIREFVNANFDTGLAKKLGLNGTNRIQVLFKINENGEVVEVKARAPHPELKEEAIRVVSLLPKMTPGRQGGKQVSVLYSLPIIFQVQ
ncbi:MAG TPA: M56 family metallopeptidase [Flavobacteriaceae bacterium]|nr:M56 family metallopeptidase [Flavobacteriaceae bacterium]